MMKKTNFVYVLKIHHSLMDNIVFLVIFLNIGMLTLARAIAVKMDLYLISIMDHVKHVLHKHPWLSVLNVKHVTQLPTTM